MKKIPFLALLLTMAFSQPVFDDTVAGWYNNDYYVPGDVIAQGFATKLWDVTGGHFETATTGVEYYSPNQNGGIYGTIYRQYFPAVLTGTNPRLDTGSIVTKIVDYVFHSKYTGTDRGLGHGNMTAYGSSDNHAYLMLSGASGGGNLSLALTGYTLLTGWVDYTRT